MDDTVPGLAPYAGVLTSRATLAFPAVFLPYGWPDEGSQRALREFLDRELSP